MVPPKPPRPTHRVVPGTTPGSTPNLSNVFNSVAPPQQQQHSSWGSINVLANADQQQHHHPLGGVMSPVIHFPHAPPTELYAFEEAPALYEAQEDFAASMPG